MAQLSRVSKDHSPSLPPPAPKWQFRRRWGHLLLAFSACALWYYLFQGFPKVYNSFKIVTHVLDDGQKKVPGWLGITPSRDLEWHECYDSKYDCARLSVNLDWQDPSDNEQVVLAIIRLKAKSREEYKGPVFINPGGPGGSGISWLLKIGNQMQTIVGDNHDIISWDPRGIGASVPRIDCWGSSQKRHEWDSQRIQVMDSHPGIIYDAFSQAKAYSRHCETHMSAETPKLLEHVSTIAHARDMLEISRKAGFEKVKYWGVSYGTILGGEFAAQFPSNVERLVSDGNVDYRDWYRNDQINFLEDADKIMGAFFSFCHSAGSSKCAFHAHTPDAIEIRFLALLARLQKEPVEIPAQAAYNKTLPITPELVTYAKLQLLVRTCLYKPIFTFPDLARTLAALEAGDGLPYYEMVHESDTESFLDLCAVNDTPPTVPLAIPVSSDDAFPAIMCSDGEPFTETPETFQTYAKELQRISKYAGTSNTHFKLSCAGRQIRAKWRGGGPFADIQTAFPILFIGNIADNVTPLQSARNNSAAFPGSALLVQRSYGHASIAAPSTCSATIVQAYFQNGSLPDPDTYCDQDYELFDDPPALVRGSTKDGLAVAVHQLSQRTNLASGF